MSYKHNTAHVEMLIQISKFLRIDANAFKLNTELIE